uniref:Uncharacterized protein n=1 Tax=Trypanosoma congolense (strain IL3000) TaxID=1068625 RepID=G0UQU8_TRYCI|nr:hypothetical protein, unlikely [Trypanosoma congolense IL3000]
MKGPRFSEEKRAECKDDRNNKIIIIIKERGEENESSHRFGLFSALICEDNCYFPIYLFLTFSSLLLVSRELCKLPFVRGKKEKERKGKQHHAGKYRCFSVCDGFDPFVFGASLSFSLLFS